MEDSKKLHEEILHFVKKEFKGILDNSDQAIYIYVCDKHKIANKKFLSMLGYSSIEEWENKDSMLSDVNEKEQGVLVSHYRAAMEKMTGSSFVLSWKNKSGSLIKTNVILVPLSYKGELFAMHFITKL